MRFLPAALLLALPLYAAPHPGIVLVTVDTLRPDHLSRYGYARATSPAIDRLLGSSMEFTNARTVEPLTSPALGSMLVSLPPHVHGATRNGIPMSPVPESLPRELHRHGYRTGAFVSNWVLAADASGFASHFDRYEERFDRKRWFGVALDEGSAGNVAEAALRWIDEDPARPFFAWLHFSEPHAPYRMHPRFADRLGIPRLLPRERDRYDTEIAAVDDAVDALLVALARRGLLDGQIIVAFAADHGEAFGEHGEWGHGRHLWDTTLRIPMAVWWPGKLQPRVVEAPATILDLAPTLLGLLELPVPSAFKGFDWSREEEPAPLRQLVFEAHKSAVLLGDRSAARAGGLLELAVLDRGIKTVTRLMDGEVFSHDLNADPGELRPLESPHAFPSVLLDRVRQRLGAAKPPPPLNDEIARRLRSLGYLR
jgi:arylsulfatase A-like enzyme